VQQIQCLSLNIYLDLLEEYLSVPDEWGVIRFVVLDLPNALGGLEHPV
jgi:hypothetical protein